MITYDDYLKEKDSITIEECESIYLDIVKQIQSHQNKECEGLFKIMQERAIAYATARANWFILSYGERGVADAERTRKHDLFIKAKSDLAKFMYENKMDIDWEDRLGEQRKRIGDFACYMVFLISLGER